MNLNFLQSLFLGFVSGLTEMLPISGEAHRAVLQTLFGIEREDAVFRLLVHIACLIALYSGFQHELLTLRRTRKLMLVPPRRRRKPLDPATAGTVRLLRTATIVMVIVRILTLSLSWINGKLNYMTAGLLFTGLLLFLPRIVRSGNMTSRNMPRIIGMLMGVGGGLGGIAGFSPVGCAMSLGQWQGVDRRYAMTFAYLLMVPGLIVHMILDLGAIVMGGAAGFSFVGLMIALAGAVVSGFGARLGIDFMKRLSQSIGFTGFAYYCWGMTMLCFILFLSI